MVRHRGDRGFRRVSWDDALDLVAARIRDAGPNRLGLYLTARGITNEVYYAAQKAARFIGTNNVDNAARVCHAPSTNALKETLGVAATTCNYRDVIESDLIVLFGADVANAQPVFMKYLYLAKKRGARIAVVNPLREPGLEHYWVPSSVESAMFGTKMTDEFFGVHTGGDVAFLNGVMKVLLAIGGIDKEFVRAHTTGFDSLLDQLEEESFDRLEDASGRDPRRHDAVRAACTRTRNRPSSCGRWGSRNTSTGVDNVKAIVNLALARGNVGRAGRGPDADPWALGRAGRRGDGLLRDRVSGRPRDQPVERGRTAPRSGGSRCPRAGASTRRRWSRARAGATSRCCGRAAATSSTCCPRPTSPAPRSARTPLRVHQDIVLTHQMLVDPGETVVLLPAATRYEQEGGGTSTTTERRVAFSPELDGPTVGEARSEYAIFLDVARAGRPGPRRSRSGARPRQAIREEIARVVPAYAGIETLRETGDAIQVGGARLCEGGVFPTADGRARFSVVVPERRSTCRPAGTCSRPGAASSSTPWCGRTSTRSPARARDALLLSEADAAAHRRRCRATRCSCVRRTARCAPARTSRRCAAATCRRSSRKRTCCSRRTGAIRSPAFPTTTRSWKWSSSRDARRPLGAVRRQRPTAVARRGRRDPPRRHPRPHRATRAVRARRRRRRGRVRGARARAGADRERGVRRARARRRGDHRRHRSGRRLHELLARHRVLGHLHRRDRRRRPRCARWS